MELMKKRSKILGLPIGPKRTNWGGLAKVAAGTAAAVGGTGAVGKKARSAMQSAKGKAEQTAGSDGEAADEDAGSEPASESSGSRQQPGATGEEDEGSEGSGGGSSGIDNLKKQRLIIREQIDVGVPCRVAYNQWTQFEDFPNIFKGIESAEQRDDETLVMKGRIFKFGRKWTARIVEQTPDERIRWVVRGGAVDHTGVVTFHELDNNLTRVQVEMEYFPSGIMEKVGNLFLAVRHRVRKDLRLFKHFIELEGKETGAWRGEINADEGDDREASTARDEGEQRKNRTDEQREERTDEQRKERTDKGQRAESTDREGAAEGEGDRPRREQGQSLTSNEGSNGQEDGEAASEEASSEEDNKQKAKQTSDSST